MIGHRRSSKESYTRNEYASPKRKASSYRSDSTIRKSEHNNDIIRPGWYEELQKESMHDSTIPFKDVENEHHKGI